jgi:hypothetical protein
MVSVFDDRLERDPPASASLVKVMPLTVNQIEAVFRTALD